MRTLFTAVLVLVVCTPVAFARKWTDSTGKYTVEAEFVELKEGKVRLRKPDGKVVTVPIETLSQEDQAFLNRQVPGKPDAERATIGLDHIDTPNRSLGEYLLDAGGKAGALVVKVGAPDVAPGADPGLVKALLGDHAEQLGTVMLFEGPIPVQLLKDKFGDPTERRGNDAASRDFGAIWQARHGNSALPGTATEWVYGNIVLLVQGDSASWWGVRRVATVQAKHGEKDGPKDNQKQVQLGLRLFKRLTYHKTDSVLSTQNDIDAVVFSRNVATEALKRDSRGNVVLSVVQAITRKYPKVQLQLYFVSQEPVTLDALKAAIGDPDNVQAGVIKEEGMTIPVSWHKYGNIEFAVTLGKIVVLRATTNQRVHGTGGDRIQDDAKGNAGENGAPQKQGDYLRSPDFKAPKGRHVAVTGQPLGDELYAKMDSIFQKAAKVWPDSKKKGNVTQAEIQKMVEMLTNEGLVGDGLYCDAGYESSGMFGFAWGFSIYGSPPKQDCKTIMRIYPNGRGMDYRTLVTTFGRPRVEKANGNMRHAIYGNVDVIYDEKGKYVGTIFFFERL